MIAVTHHVLIRYAAALCGNNNFTQYMVLGDDVVIANKAVAISYQELIVSIGVQISTTKRIIPQDGFYRVEFASKLTLNGVEVSPLPLGLLLEGR